MQERKIDDEKLLEMIEAGKNGKECAAFFKCSEAAISKRVKRLQPPPESLQKLTAKEQRFCIEVASGKTQTQAALDSFECNSRASAKAIGCALMTRPEVEMAVSDLMREAGLTRRYRLQKIKQHVDHRSADISLKALDMANKIDGLYAPERHVSLNFNITQTTEKLQKLRAARALLDELDGLSEGSEEYQTKLTQFDAMKAELDREG
jgi:hypothetical protein